MNNLFEKRVLIISRKNSKKKAVWLALLGCRGGGDAARPGRSPGPQGVPESRERWVGDEGAQQPLPQLH